MTAVMDDSSLLKASLAPAPTLASTQDISQSTSYRQWSRPKVYVTRRIPQKGMDILLQACDVKQWDAEQAVPRGELLHSVVGVEGILCMQSDSIDADVLDAAGPDLCVVATMSVSTHHINMEECKRRGIQVLVCPDQPTETQAELTVALILLTIKESETDQERLSNFELHPPDLISDNPGEMSSVWVNNRPRLMRRMSEELLAYQWTNGKPGNTNCPTWKNIARKTFGIYGMTKLGQCVAKILKTFGVSDVLISDMDTELDNSNISSSNSGCDLVPFEELLEKSDVICVCGSSGKQSDGIFCREAFKKMKKSAILIASQHEEPAIDYVDLYTALRDREIKSAGLNDCNQEPVPFKIPLLGLKNCTFLPQTQESVYDMRHKVSVLITKNLTDALKKKGAYHIKKSTK